MHQNASLTEKHFTYFISRSDARRRQVPDGNLTPEKAVRMQGSASVDCRLYATFGYKRPRRFVTILIRIWCCWAMHMAMAHGYNGIEPRGCHCPNSIANWKKCQQMSTICFLKQNNRTFSCLYGTQTSSSTRWVANFALKPSDFKLWILNFGFQSDKKVSKHLR